MEEMEEEANMCCFTILVSMLTTYMYNYVFPY